MPTTERRRQRSQPKREMLLREYELCQQAAANIDASIWQTSTLIGAGSVTALAIVANSESPWILIFLVGILSSTLVYIWWCAACRWWEIQHTKIMRKRHIEERLHLFQDRYISHRDGQVELRCRDLGGDKIAKSQLAELSQYTNERAARRFPRLGVRKWFRLFPWMNAGLWLILTLGAAIWRPLLLTPPLTPGEPIAVYPLEGMNPAHVVLIVLGVSLLLLGAGLLHHFFFPLAMNRDLRRVKIRLGKYKASLAGRKKPDIVRGSKPRGQRPRRHVV